MTIVLVDVEADGPCPGLYSMTEIGMVAVSHDDAPAIIDGYKGLLSPLPGASWRPENLKVTGTSREQVEAYPQASQTILEAIAWVERHPPPLIFMSDNLAFDWQFWNYYCHLFAGRNPFGHTGMHLGSLFKGMKRDVRVSFKYLRRTPHDHDPLNDAMGNAEALREIIMMGMSMKVGKRKRQ